MQSNLKHTRSFRNQLIDLDIRHRSKVMKFSIDLLIWALAPLLAFFIRYDWSIPAGSLNGIVTVTALFTLLKVAATVPLGFYRRSWIKVAFRDVGDIVKVTLGVAFAVSVLLLWLGPTLQIPRSIALLDGFITLLAMSGARAAFRYWHESQLNQNVADQRHKNVLIIGAGEAGSLIVREMLRHPETGLQPIGFLDDDAEKARLPHCDSSGTWQNR